MNKSKKLKNKQDLALKESLIDRAQMSSESSKHCWSFRPGRAVIQVTMV